jgi:hypothetical protein
MKPFARILGYGALLALACASLLAQDSSRTGIIAGVVLDAADQPVSDARVRANFNGAWDRIVPSAFTDKSGHFVIRGLGWGEWYVTPSKEEDGYPDESNAFYAGPSFAPVIVALDAEHSRADVTVHLGRKAGTIYGTIADADSDEPIEPCAQLQWKNAPSISWFGYGLLKSKFRLLVPADTEITLEVWAWGYEPWFYKGEDGTDVLRVPASNQLELRVRLTPNRDKTRKPTDKELKKMRDSGGISVCTSPPPRR